MIDAIACEVQFLDHLAPVWLALHPSLRGRFLVDPALGDRARAKGIEPEPIDVAAIRRIPQQPPVHDGIPTLVSSIGDIKVGRRLGHGPYAFIEHGCGQSYDVRSTTAASYPGGPDRADNELFMMPNEYSANLWRRAYPSARVEIVGSPRIDALPRREPGPGPVVAVSFHGPWPHAVAYGGTAYSDFHTALPKLAQRYTVIGHAHPGKDWGARLARSYAKMGIPFVADFDDVCRQADVYVCDNSSTIFEFASTGRPVVLMNARVWHRKGGPGGRFWDWAHVGINVDPTDDLGDSVARALEDSVDQQVAREDALSKVYGLRTNGAAAASTAITDWLASKTRLAA